jgi:hypothetical protein
MIITDKKPLQELAKWLCESKNSLVLVEKQERVDAQGITKV